MDPMQMLQPYFRPPVDYLVQGKQQADRMTQHNQNLGERQRQFDENQPYRQAQTDLARERFLQAKRARESFQSIHPEVAKLYAPQGMDGKTFMTFLEAGHDPWKWQPKQPKLEQVLTPGPDGPVYKWVQPSAGMTIPAAQKTGTPRRIGDTRSFNQDGRSITQEWDGQGWRQLGSSPQWNTNTNRSEKDRANQGILKSYEATVKQLNNIWADDLWDEKADLAPIVNNLIRNQLYYAKAYVNNGGDVGALGIGLPQGLEIDDLIFNFEKYGKRPDETIQKYLQIQRQ
jgi:hypothetical protein